MKPHIKLKLKPKFELIELQPYQANQKAIDLCIQITEMASNGEITGIAIACTKPDGGISNCYSTGRNNWHLIGAIEDLKQRLLKVS